MNSDPWVPISQRITPIPGRNGDSTHNQITSEQYIASLGKFKFILVPQWKLLSTQAPSSSDRCPSTSDAIIAKKLAVFSSLLAMWIGSESVRQSRKATELPRNVHCSNTVPVPMDSVSQFKQWWRNGDSAIRFVSAVLFLLFSNVILLIQTVTWWWWWCSSITLNVAG